MDNCGSDQDNRAPNNDRYPKSLRDARIGDTITFGTYPQEADGEAPTAISWRVLQNDGGELFLLSELLLDCKRYHHEDVNITWRDCDLRRWLNDGFYNAAFSADEKRLIQTTLCTGNGEGCPDTEDKVFLLSAAEMQELKKSVGARDYAALWRTVGTEAARARKDDGCRLFVYKGSIEAGYETRFGERQGCSWWWLRTQRAPIERAYFVGVYGSLRGYGLVSLNGYGVRPAVRLKVG